MSKKEAGDLSFTSGPVDEGKRIDSFLAEKLKTSRSQVQKIISGKKVKVGGNAVSKSYQLSGGESISVDDTSVEDTQSGIEPQKIDLNILYEDKYLLVISKKAGMVTHPGPGTGRDTLVNALLYHFKNLSMYSGRERAGIVHRLDRDTSGLLIIAKDNETHRLLSEKFKNREIKKTYTALVAGNFKEKEGKIIFPVGRSATDRKKMGVSLQKGREAETGFSIVESFGNLASLIKVFPRTGRTHQIRVHFSYIGHPIIGDKVYGNKESNIVAARAGLKRQFLHASRIEFTHPVSGEEVDISDEIAPDLKESLESLRVPEGSAGF